MSLKHFKDVESSFKVFPQHSPEYSSASDSGSDTASCTSESDHQTTLKPPVENSKLLELLRLFRADVAAILELLDDLLGPSA